MVKNAPPPPAKINGVLAGRVWVLNGAQLEPRDLRIGRSDGRIPR